MRLLRLAPWLVLSLARGGAAAAAAWRDLSRRNSPADLMNDAARGLTDAQVKALALHLGSP